MKKRILIGIILSLLCACTGKNINTTYKYNDTNLGIDFNVSKMEVNKDNVKLYCVTDLDLIQNVVIIDQNFKRIFGDCSFSYKNKVLTVNTSHANQVSGMEIAFSQDYSVRLRYLDSHQYAILEDIFVCDIGMEEIGDTEAYYTKEELDEFKRIEQEKQKEIEENFKKIEGTWFTEDDKNEIIFKQEDEMVIVFKEENEKPYDYYITSIYLDYYDGEYSLGIECGIGYAPYFSFTMNEDMTILNFDGKIPYYRQK